MNKFNARKCFVDGKKFDSVAEAEHYLILKDRQKRGEIYGLECQKRFVVIEAQVKLLISHGCASIGGKRVKGSSHSFTDLTTNWMTVPQNSIRILVLSSFPAQL